MLSGLPAKNNGKRITCHYFLVRVITDWGPPGLAGSYCQPVLPGCVYYAHVIDGNSSRHIRGIGVYNNGPEVFNAAFIAF